MAADEDEEEKEEEEMEAEEEPDNTLASEDSEKKDTISG